MGLHWREAEALRGLGFFTIIIIIIIISFYLWRSRAPQLLFPESSSSSPPLSLSLPQSLPGARGTSRARPDQRENRAGGGGGGGDQRPRDHARAVRAAASCRAPSPRSTSNNLAARAPRTLVRRRPPGLEAARARNALALWAQSVGTLRGATWGVSRGPNRLLSRPATRAHAREGFFQPPPKLSPFPLSLAPSSVLL